MSSIVPFENDPKVLTMLKGHQSSMEYRIQNFTHAGMMGSLQVDIVWSTIEDAFSNNLDGNNRYRMIEEVSRHVGDYLDRLFFNLQSEISMNPNARDRFLG